MVEKKLQELNWDHDVIRPHIISEPRVKRDADVAIVGSNGVGSGRQVKPYPVQPGYDLIRVQMEQMRNEVEKSLYSHLQKDEGCINDAQLSMVITNIVHVADQNALEAFVDRNPAIINALFIQDFTAATSLMHLCAIRGVKELLDVLTRKGANIDLKAGNGETPLHVACRRGILSTVRYLIEHGADMNAVDNHNNSMAHYAAQTGSSFVLELLYERGLDLNLRNECGQTIAHVMIQYSMNSCMQLMMKHRRVDPKIENNNGFNALDMAIRYGEANQCSYILESYPGMAKSLKAVPSIDSFEDHKTKLRVFTALGVVKQAGRPKTQKLLEYMFLASQSFLAVLFSLLLKSVFGYQGVWLGGVFLTFVAYYIFNSSHRLEFERTPNPRLVGAFFTGLFFTSICSVQIVFYPDHSPTKLSTAATSLTETTTSAISMDSWLIKSYLLFLLVCVWGMYGKLINRGNNGANCGTIYLNHIWELAYDKSKQLQLCLLCYTLAKNKRTKHCKLCELCITDLDHHCVYLLSCIGRHNHRLFILFSIATLIAQVSFVAFGLEKLRSEDNSAQIDDNGYRDLFTRNNLLFLCLPPNIISAIWGASFVKSQLSTISKGETSYFQNYLTGKLLKPQERFQNVVKFFRGTSFIVSSDKTDFI